MVFVVTMFAVLRGKKSDNGDIFLNPTEFISVFFVSIRTSSCHAHMNVQVINLL